MTFEKLFYLMVFCEFFLFHPFEVLLSNGIISLSYQMGKYFEEINRTIYFVCGTFDIDWL